MGEVKNMNGINMMKFHDGKTTVAFIGESVAMAYEMKLELEGFEAKEMFVLTAQIWHTHLNLFSLRHAIPLDHDERRPIYQFHFDSYEKLALFIKKHTPDFLAFESFVIKDGEQFVNYYGRDIEMLRSFKAWTHFLMNNATKGNSPCVPWATDVLIGQCGGGFYVNKPDVTKEQFLHAVETEEPITRPSGEASEDVLRKIEEFLENTPEIAKAERELVGATVN